MPYACDWDAGILTTPQRGHLDRLPKRPNLTEDGLSRTANGVLMRTKTAGERPAFPTLPTFVAIMRVAMLSRRRFHPSGNGINGQACALSLAARSGTLEVGK